MDILKKKRDLVLKLMNNKYTYEAKVLRIVDGDTIDVEIDLGFSTYRRERIRLYGINTPETYGVKRDSDEYVAGTKAKDYVIGAIEPMTQGERIIIQTIKDKKGKYGRYLANVYYKRSTGPEAEWIWLNQELVDKGLAKVM